MFDLDESRPDSQAVHRAEPESDAEVLDSYSATVTGAVEKAGPAVVNIAVTTPQGRGGAGSGFLVSADGMLVERYQGLVSNETLSRKLDRLLATAHR